MNPAADHLQVGNLLHYRAWHGVPVEGSGRGWLLLLGVQSALLGVATVADDWPWLRLGCSLAFLCLWGLVVRLRAWPIARVSLVLILRRKLFWFLYALALTAFLLFFFGQYLMSWASTQLGDTNIRVGNFGRANPADLVRVIRDVLKLNGSDATFRNFFNVEGYNVMIILALAGSVIIGNDMRYGSLAFYLARPISRWDYLLGKGLAVALFINLLTTLPAIVLFVQYGLLEDWDYFLEHGHLLAGILAYGMLLTFTLTTMLLAAAAWLRRTVPLIMTWTTLFLFCRIFADTLVDRMNWDARWRLIDLWNSTVLLGSHCLRMKAESIVPANQPEWYEAALVLGGVCALCLSYLILRIKAVEIVQ